MQDAERIVETNPFFDQEHFVDVTLEQIEQLKIDKKCTVVTRTDHFYDPNGIQMVYIFTPDCRPFIPYIPLYVSPQTGCVYLNTTMFGKIPKEVIKNIEEKILQRD